MVKASYTSSGSPHPQEEQVLHSCRIQQFSFGFPQREPVQNRVVLGDDSTDHNSCDKMGESTSSNSPVLATY
jgi:hypothetical protein